MAFKDCVVPLVCATQVAPVLVVFRINPPAPAMYPVGEITLLESKNTTPFNCWVTPLLIVLQLVPVLVLLSKVPEPPTAKAVVPFNCIPYKGAGVAVNDLISGRVQVSFFSSPSGVVVDLSSGTAQDGWGTTDTISGVENVEGSDRDDTITGNSASNVIEGGVGAANLHGGRAQNQRDRALAAFATLRKTA